uniref:RRM domain-containing protein n=1 Tax=Amphimedon queenslandica TaxID=400682 RepID=A0A1X7TAZ4_AMPQE
MKKQRRRRSTDERSLASPVPPFLPPQRDLRSTESPRGYSHYGPRPAGTYSSPPTATVEQHTLKVTNLSPNVTQEEMEAVCASYLDYQSLKVNDRHAFVNFLSLKGAERAMERLRKVKFHGQRPIVHLHNKSPKSESQLRSHYGQTSCIPPPFLITPHHFSSPRTVSPQALQVETSTVKVTLSGHSGHGVKGEALEEYFSQFGEVLQTPAIIPGTPDYAYVNFKTSEEAKAACNPNEVHLDGIVMMIKLSNKAPASTSSKLVTFEDDSLVNAITMCKLSELKDQLSSAVTAKSSKDLKSVRISGDKDKVDEAESVVRSYMKHLQ